MWKKNKSTGTSKWVLPFLEEKLSIIFNAAIHAQYNLFFSISILSPPPPQVLQTSLKLSLRLGQTASGRNTSFLSGSKFDVFSSFRGEDTRTNFTDHLYADLVEKRIHTFRDNEELRRGDIICVKLLQAIE